MNSRCGLVFIGPSSKTSPTCFLCVYFIMRPVTISASCLHSTGGVKRGCGGCVSGVPYCVQFHAEHIVFRILRGHPSRFRVRCLKTISYLVISKRCAAATVLVIFSLLSCACHRRLNFVQLRPRCRSLGFFFGCVVRPLGN